MRVDLYGDEIGNVTLIDAMGDDLRAVQSARVSFLRDELDRSEPNERDTRLIRFLLREGHTSPFEHSVITFRVTVPLFVRAQIMRHRTFSYNEVSRRYTSEKLEILIPQELRTQSESNLQCSDGVMPLSEGGELMDRMRAHMRESLNLYGHLISHGVTREQARAVLPQSMYTTFWMTGNLHNFIKFLRLRLDEHTQAETRAVAEGMRELLSALFPVTFEALDQ